MRSQQQTVSRRLLTAHQGPGREWGCRLTIDAKRCSSRSLDGRSGLLDEYFNDLVERSVVTLRLAVGVEVSEPGA